MVDVEGCQKRSMLASPHFCWCNGRVYDGEHDHRRNDLGLSTGFRVTAEAPEQIAITARSCTAVEPADRGKLIHGVNLVASTYNGWLVVWNMNFIVLYIGNVIIPIDSYIF